MEEGGGGGGGGGGGAPVVVPMSHVINNGISVPFLPSLLIGLSRKKNV